ncbi:hypothetical protein KPL70_014605 [Citrus sinensis]|nr:hypothetical protein KPL70_014605 [Citrus sinensis]
MAAEIDKKARSTIILSLGDSVIREVAKEKTVADLWAKLEKIYMTKSLANRLYIKRRMFTLKMAEGSSLDDHIDEFNQVCDTLETIDEGLDDEGKAFLLVSYLPQSYSNLVDALMYGRSTLSLDEVKAALNTRGLQEKSGNMMHAEGLSIKEDLQRGKWILDSGCIFHMCPFKTYFSDYHDLDGGKVIMGNNAVCKVIGMGNVSLRLHDGTIWELREVRYVPDLKRNLISLGLIDHNGFSIKLESGRLLIMKGSKIVMKGFKRNGVYILDGEAVTGITDVIVRTGGESTRLWHLRLGVWVYVLKHKDQVFNKFKEWKTLVENQTGKKVKKLRTDNGLEFWNQQFNSYCANEGIARHKTVRLTPQQNGLAERMNRTLMDKVRCMLVQAKFPKSLWAETLLTASYLVNLSPSAALDFKTPFEMWHGKPASYVNLKVFGCPAYAHISQGKLAPRALKGQFLGYPDGVKGYKLWCTDLEPPRCIISRDVAFNENVVLEIRKDVGLKTQKPQTQVQSYQLTKDREKREIRPPQRYGYADLIAYALAASHDIDVDEPKSYAEAIQSSNKSEWQEAMNDEIASLKKNHTRILIEKPGNRRTMGCKWVFRVKEGLTASEPKRYKARLVAKGYTQREGVDFKEVFSPVGYVDSEKPNHVCLLKRSLYGLKQSPRQWYLRFDEFILSHGYLRCSFDCSVYYKLISTNLYIYLLLYVDDMLVAYKSREEIEALKNLLSSEFEMKDLGSAKKILGMEIKRDRSKGIMFLSQKKYLRRVLETFGMTSCKPVMTPIATHFKLSSLQCSKTEEEKLEMAKIPYANVVGCMMYAMVLTRPDISYALSVVSRYMVSPGKEHWRVVKWVLRYLSGTLDHGLVYGKSRIKSKGISGFVDSDFAGDLDRRRSLAGYLYMLDGCLINWKASLQHVVALSTTEAEYTAAAEAVKEALWLKGLISELGMSQKTVDVFCDSSSAIYLSKNPAHHENTKHIDIKLHFIRNVVSMGVVRMVKIHTDRNPADMLTKVVTTAKFKVCLDIACLGCY